VAVLGLRNGGIARISLFGDPAVARRFNTPDHMGVSSGGCETLMVDAPR
jgi:hypothetical protein